MRRVQVGTSSEHSDHSCSFSLVWSSKRWTWLDWFCDVSGHTTQAKLTTPFFLERRLNYSFLHPPRSRPYCVMNELSNFIKTSIINSELQLLKPPFQVPSHMGDLQVFLLQLNRLGDGTLFVILCNKAKSPELKHISQIHPKKKNPNPTKYIHNHFSLVLFKMQYNNPNTFFLLLW